MYTWANHRNIDLNVWGRIWAFEGYPNLITVWIANALERKKGPTTYSKGEADFTDPKIDIKLNSDFEYPRKHKGNHINMA